MKKSIFVVAAVLATSIAFAQKKEKQLPPPPPPVVDVNEVPPPPPSPPLPNKVEVSKEEQAFFKKSPTVSGVERNNNEVRIHLKSGKEELFDMNNKDDVEKLKNQYGELPAPPPPPPPPPPAPKVSKQITES